MDEQYTPETSPQSYNTEIKILTNPGLASSCFKQLVNYIFFCTIFKSLPIKMRSQEE